jgi:hypothetical protein
VVSGNDLKMFGNDGVLGPAVVTPGITSSLSSTSDCPLLIDDRKPRDIALSGEVTNDRWWISIGYLASRDGEVVVEAGETQLKLDVLEGPHTLLFTSTGRYDSITILNRTERLGLCIDDAKVGFIGTFS